MRDDRALLREALDVLGLLLEEALRDQQRKVRVLVAGLLEAGVQPALDVLPQRVAPRLDHHAAAHRRLLGEIGRLDHLLIPLGIVFCPRRTDRVLFLLGHSREG
jgi:hypothetical protein